MDKRPLITVIAAIYNVEDYVEKCIQSIVDQTWRELEIILVDDGSTDKSGQICDRFAAQDSRVRVIHRPENSGSPGGPRNQGLAEGTGEWFVMADGDDNMDPDMVEYLYGLYEKTGCYICQCAVRHVGFPDAKDKLADDSDYRVLTGREAAESALTRMGGYISTAMHTLLHRSVVRRLSFLEVRGFEDIDYSFFAAFDCEKVCCSKALKYNYVYRGNNAASTKLPVKIGAMNAVLDRIRVFIEDRAPELLDALSQRYVDMSLYILEYAVRHGMTQEEKTAFLELKDSVLDKKITVRKFCKTSRLLYCSLKAGDIPFRIMSKTIFALKSIRAKIKRRLHCGF